MKVALVWALPQDGETIAVFSKISREVIPEAGDKVRHREFEYVVMSRTWDMLEQSVILWVA